MEILCCCGVRVASLYLSMKIWVAESEGMFIGAALTREKAQSLCKEELDGVYEATSDEVGFEVSIPALSW